MLLNDSLASSQLFVDKDTITNAVNTSHDLHNQKIDNKVSVGRINQNDPDTTLFIRYTSKSV